MSAVPFVVRNTRFGSPLGVNIEFEDGLTKGSLDTFCNFTMPQTAENLAEKYKLLRGEVDEFALQSQQRWKAGEMFDERDEMMFVKCLVNENIFMKFLVIPCSLVKKGVSLNIAIGKIRL